MKKWCLCSLYMTVIILSLAACGKAISASNPSADTEEIHRAFVDENQAETAESSDEIILAADKINVGFCQASNYEEWQVAQTESFYNTFMEKDGYKLFITDAHGDEDKQAEQLEKLIAAPVEVIFVVPVDREGLSEILERAETSGIRVFVLDETGNETISGREARKALEDRSMEALING